MIKTSYIDKERVANQALSLIRAAKVNRLERASATLRAAKGLTPKRELGSSEDSDPSHLKPAMQKMREENGAITRSKRWRTMPKRVKIEQYS
jgi:hypothetical protein